MLCNILKLKNVQKMFALPAMLLIQKMNNLVYVIPFLVLEAFESLLVFLRSLITRVPILIQPDQPTRVSAAGLSIRPAPLGCG